MLISNLSENFSVTEARDNEVNEGPYKKKNCYLLRRFK